MKDYAGRTIRIGDKIAYFCSNQSGGLDRYTFIVKDLTAKRVVVHDQRSFARERRYLSPGNCVVIQQANTDTENLVPIEINCYRKSLNETQAWMSRRIREQLSRKLMEALRQHNCITSSKDENDVVKMSVKLYAVRGEENEQNQCNRTDRDSEQD